MVEVLVGMLANILIFDIILLFTHGKFMEVFLTQFLDFPLSNR